jgi:hypothetical protein
MARRPVYQFKITLEETDPAIWRRIQISDLGTFWDLHVAIQDSMGWLNYHLHQFNMPSPESNDIVAIALPDDEFGDRDILTCYEVKVRDFFNSENRFCQYTYDFGDNWTHFVEFEGSHEKVEGKKYPICLGGENACPPEDVGGIPGYEDFVEIMKDPEHEEYESMLEWCGQVYKPNYFSVENVRFNKPTYKLREWIPGI